MGVAGWRAVGENLRSARDAAMSAGTAAVTAIVVASATARRWLEELGVSDRYGDMLLWRCSQWRLQQVDRLCRSA